MTAITLPNKTNSNPSCGARITDCMSDLTPREFNKLISIKYDDTAKPKTPACFRTPIGASSTHNNVSESRLTSGRLFKDNKIFNRGSHVVGESMESIVGTRHDKIILPPQRRPWDEKHKNEARSIAAANKYFSRNTNVGECMAPRPMTREKFKSFERQRRTITSREARGAVQGESQKPWVPPIDLPPTYDHGPYGRRPAPHVARRANHANSLSSSVDMYGVEIPKKDEIFYSPRYMKPHERAPEGLAGTRGSIPMMLPPLGGQQPELKLGAGKADADRNKELLRKVNLELRGGTPWTYPARHRHAGIYDKAEAPVDDVYM